jgi:NAD(P)-dependent dehydrogenase (short-subunit alcohol dehydrogenase family)
MQLELSGSIAVVTGGASGIGFACARALAFEGCLVSLWDLSESVEAVAHTISVEAGVQIDHVSVDVRDATAVETALRHTRETLGPVSHLVHAAAAGSGKFGYPFTNLKPSDWLKVLDVNVMGMVNVAHAIAPGMMERRNGTMVFVGSVAGQIGSQTDPPYSASKAANINFTQCLAKDLAPHNVRVNVVNPGMVRTPLNRGVWQAWNNQQAPDMRRTCEEWGDEKVRAVVPLGRWQGVDDIADTVLFLSSARAAQITGQTINVDGGQVMHW